MQYLSYANCELNSIKYYSNNNFSLIYLILLLGEFKREKLKRINKKTFQFR